MGLPHIACPACNSHIPLEAWLAHVGARQALLALADLHGSLRLPAVALRYLALFAPEKRTLSFDRIADLLVGLGELIRPARVEWRGRAYAAPLEAWIAGMEQMLADPRIRRPLKNHNYLRAVVAGLADQHEADLEARVEQTRQGVAGTGGGAERAQRAAMPAHIRDQLKSFTTAKGDHHG